MLFYRKGVDFGGLPEEEFTPPEEEQEEFLTEEDMEV